MSETRVLVEGGIIDVTEYSTLASTLVRIGQRTGINRIPRDVTPNPLIYARRFDKRQSTEVEVDAEEEVV